MESPVGRALWMGLFAVAMGLLEAAVVVYLRELYYPGGFRFPIVLLPPRLAIVEILREATTIVMLLAVAVLTGRGGHDRFFAFAFLFGVWDLVYYAGLWLFLRWPSSLLDWDLLFLIPVPWIGPVVYPVLISLLLVLGFAVHEVFASHGHPVVLGASGWIVATAGALLVILSFCGDWRVVTEGRLPGSFPLPLFAAGLLVATAPFALATWRALRPAR